MNITLSKKKTLFQSCDNKNNKATASLIWMLKRQMPLKVSYYLFQQDLGFPIFFFFLKALSKFLFEIKCLNTPIKKIFCWYILCRRFNIKNKLKNFPYFLFQKKKRVIKMLMKKLFIFSEVAVLIFFSPQNLFEILFFFLHSLL